MSAAAGAASDQGSGAKIKLTATLTMKANVAASLPLREMAPFSRHSRIDGPKLGFSTSQRSSRGLPRPKKNAARITKTVVGRTGSSAPRIASPRHRPPAAI